MKRKFFSVFFALVLVLSFSLVTAVPVGAATEVWVDDDFTEGTEGWNVTHFDTIQEGVAVVDPNGMVNVAEGVYDEQVVIGKSLTLQGVGDTTVIQPSGNDTLTEVRTTPWLGPDAYHLMAAIVFVDAPGLTVTVKDLKIDGENLTSVDLPGDGTASVNWLTGLAYLETSGTIDAVTVEDMNTGNTPRTCGIWSSAETNTSSVTVQNCTVTNYNRAGVYGIEAQLTVDFNHNTITGPGSHTTQVPNSVFIMDGCNGSVTYNDCSSNFYDPVNPDEYRATGIGTYSAGPDVIFAYNTVHEVQNAFALAKDTSGTIVEYNNIFNNHTGVRIEQLAANSIIQYNDIQGNDFAIRCRGMGDGNEAHNNNFVNNPGLAWENVESNVPYIYEGAVCNLDVTYTLDATNNWWGATNGPSGQGSGDGDAVSANVNFDPWLDSPYEESGGAVSMTAASEEVFIGISVSPTFIEFGAVTSGLIVSADARTIKNTGNVEEKVTAEVYADTEYASGTYFYTAALKLSDYFCSLQSNPTALGGTWTAEELGLTSIPVGSSKGVSVELVCPSEEIFAGKIYTGTVVFWAEQK